VQVSLAAFLFYLAGLILLSLKGEEFGGEGE